MIVLADDIKTIFLENLPKKPYCSDDLMCGLLIRPSEIAMKKRYIQANKPTDTRWLVYDVDRPTSHFDWQDSKNPSPNMTVMNKKNGHSHLIYGLEVPVYQQARSRLDPQRYLSSIDVALTKELRADPGYSKLICKNPLNDYWETEIWKTYLYDLNGLADWLDLEPYKDRRRHLPSVGLGRNCTLFEITRSWAYREIRKPQGWLCEEFFISAVIDHACIVNQNFPYPLRYPEVKATGKSIGKWVYRNMSPEGFSQWANNRRQKSIATRKAQAEEMALNIKEYKKTHPGASTRQIASVFNVTAMSVSRYLRSL